MQAYQIEHDVPPTHRVAFDLPANSPVGSAKIIVLFPEPTSTTEKPKPRFANMAEFATWLSTQPPTGRTAEEIDQYIREERDSWE